MFLLAIIVLLLRMKIDLSTDLVGIWDKKQAKSILLLIILKNVPKVNLDSNSGT